PDQPAPVAMKMPAARSTTGVTITQTTTTTHFEQPPQGFAQKGYRTVLWTAHDDNEDELQFAVYYRGENEKEWKLLKDKLDQKYYSFDTATLPDGAYYLKIVTSDSDRKSTRLNSSHVSISYAVFCLKKKKKKI